MSTRRPRAAAARPAPTPPESAEPAPPEPAPPEPPQLRSPYVLFKLRVSLSESGQIHNTTAIHADGHEEERWAGWDVERLTDFVMRHVASHPALPPAAPDEAPPPAAEAARQEPPVTIRFAERSLARPRRAGAPLELHLSVEPSRGPADVSYELTAYAHPVAGGRLILGSWGGALRPEDRALTLTATPLDPGLYRLRATVTLRDGEPAEPWQATIEGQMIQVA